MAKILPLHPGGVFTASDGTGYGRTMDVEGLHFRFHWGDIETSPGVYNWRQIDNWVTANDNAGKSSTFGIMLMSFRGDRDTATNKDAMPKWALTSEYGVITGCPEYPMINYAHSALRTRLEALANALATRYQNDPRVDSIEIALGHQGEMRPASTKASEACSSTGKTLNQIYIDTWNTQSYTWPWTGTATTSARSTWVAFTRFMVDIYKAAFGTKKALYLMVNGQIQSAFEKTDAIVGTSVNIIDYAISQGVGFKNTGLRDDLGNGSASPREGYQNWRNIFTQSDEQTGQANGSWLSVPTSGEHFGATPQHTGGRAYWTFLTSLRLRCDQVHLFRSILEQPGATEGAAFYRKYGSKNLSNTPGAWIVLRETRPDQEFMPDTGNYAWWLYQDETPADGVTFPEWNDNSSSVISSLDSDFRGLFTRRIPQRLYLRVDPDYINNRAVTVDVRVTYFDGPGTGTWELYYDYSGYAVFAGGVVRSGSNTWKVAEFSFTSTFGKTISGNDLYIDSGGENLWVHKVEILPQDFTGPEDPEPEPEPEPEPDPIEEPDPEPEPDPPLPEPPPDVEEEVTSPGTPPPLQPIIPVPPQDRLQFFPQASTVYVGIQRGKILWRGVMSAINESGTQLTVTTLAGDFALVLPGLSLWCGTPADPKRKGNVRIISAVGNVIQVAPNNIDWEVEDLLTVDSIVRPYSIIGMHDAGEDPPATYPFPPVPVMGPNRYAWVNEPISFMQGIESWARRGKTIASYLWNFEDGEVIEGSVGSPGSPAAPLRVQWPSWGERFIRLRVTDSAGESATGYRCVFVFERP